MSINLFWDWLYVFSDGNVVGNLQVKIACSLPSTWCREVEKGVVYMSIHSGDPPCAVNFRAIPNGSTLDAANATTSTQTRSV